MEIMYVLMPIALIFALGFLFAFQWANRQGQFDDLETPKHRMLIDDDRIGVSNER